VTRNRRRPDMQIRYVEYYVVEEETINLGI
jgi:hypothetical protein